MVATAPSIFSVDFSLSGLMFPAGSRLMKILSIIHRRTGCPLWARVCSSVNFISSLVGGTQCILLNGEDVTDDIRTPEISMLASKVSAIPEVRDFLFDLQQKIAKEHHVIMDGRDIGTVVLPDADLKIFLTASPEERASRRYLELQEKPDAPTYEQILQDIKKRDYQDTHREIAPLRQAEDAVLIDTTNMGFHEVCDALLELMEERLDLE